MTALMIVTAALLGAFSWRIRGGWLGRYNPGGTQVARLAGALPLALLAWWVSGNWIAGAIAMTHAPVLMLWGWWDSMANTSGDKLNRLTGRGILQTCFLGTLAVGLGVLPVWTGLLYQYVGVLMGVIYWAAWKRTWPVVNLLGSGLIDGPAAVAEMGTGAWLYGTYIGALLLFA